jgi:DNA polymerase I
MYVFIDGSYFIFYRYYAISTWYKKNKPDTDPDTKVMMDKYKEMFEKTIIKIMKEHKIAGKDLYFVKDCGRENIWRYKLYKDYKATRDDSGLKRESIGEVFRHTYTYILPHLVTKLGFNVLSEEHLEADDIIAIATRQLVERNESVAIITNDKDYIQLCGPNVFIKNLQNTELTSDNPKRYLQLKIILGDKSDNITPIMKKCGPKTAEKLVDNPEELLKLFDKHPEVKEKYELNKLLIDFQSIPEKYLKIKFEI